MSTSHPTADELSEFSIRAYKGVEVGLGQSDPGAAIASKLAAQNPGHLVLVQAGTFLHGYDGELTPHACRGYSVPAAEKKAVGIGSPDGAAKSRKAPAVRLFSCLCAPLWAGRAGSRKACRCSTGLPTRSVPSTRLEAGRRFVNRTGAHIMNRIPSPGAASFQTRVGQWQPVCFSPEVSQSLTERNHRFLEESLELVQACGCTASEAHQLVDYVFGRAVGDPFQETGGVMVTLAALCLAHGMDMVDAGETELRRIWTKVEEIRAKHATKPRYLPAGPRATLAHAGAQS